MSEAGHLDEDDGQSFTKDGLQHQTKASRDVEIRGYDFIVIN